SHLTTFTDLQYGGPNAFFYNIILRFPQAPSLASQYGTAMHETMEWIQHYIDRKNTFPSEEALISKYDDFIRSKKLPDDKYKLELEKGVNSLSVYSAKRSHLFKQGDKAEFNFRNENVFIDNAH